MEIYLALFFLLTLVFLFLTLRYRGLYLTERHRKTSLSVRHGKFMEQYIPWIKKIFPHDPKRFRFIGYPIDGILFGEDKIIFMEFKTGKSSLSPVQKKIRSLVQSKKVEWKEIRTN